MHSTVPNSFRMNERIKIVDLQLKKEQFNLRM